MDVFTHPVACRLREASSPALRAAVSVREARRASLTSSSPPPAAASLSSGPPAAAPPALETLPGVLLAALAGVEAVVVDSSNVPNPHLRGELVKLRRRTVSDLVAALAEVESRLESPAASPATTRWNNGEPPPLHLGLAAVSPPSHTCSLLEALPVDVLVERLLCGAEVSTLGALCCTSKRLAASLGSKGAASLWGQRWDRAAWGAPPGRVQTAGSDCRQRYCQRANLDCAWLSTTVAVNPGSGGGDSLALTPSAPRRPSAATAATAAAWLCAPQHCISALSYDPASGSVATGDTTGTVRLWDVQKSCASFWSDRRGEVRPTHGKRTVGRENGISRDARLAVIRVGGKNAGRVLWTSHSGRLLLAATANGRLNCYDLESSVGGSGTGLSVAAGQVVYDSCHEVNCGLLGSGGSGLARDLCWVGGRTHVSCYRLPEVSSWEGRRTAAMECVHRQRVTEEEDGSVLKAVLALGGGGYAIGAASGRSGLAAVADSSGAVSLVDLAVAEGDAAADGGHGTGSVLQSWVSPHRQQSCEHVSLAAVPALASSWLVGTAYSGWAGMGSGGFISLMDARSPAAKSPVSTHHHKTGVRSMFAPPHCSLPLVLLAETGEEKMPAFMGSKIEDRVRVLDLRMLRASDGGRGEPLQGWAGCGWADFLISHSGVGSGSDGGGAPGDEGGGVGGGAPRVARGVGAEALAGDEQTLVAVLSGGGGAAVVRANDAIAERHDPVAAGAVSSSPGDVGGVMSPSSSLPSLSSSPTQQRQQSRREKNKAKKKGQDQFAGEIDKGAGGRRRFPKKSNRRGQ